MWIKNNSDRGWENYNCGRDVSIDIKPNSEFEVDEDSAKVLLKNLGHENWLVQIEGPAKKGVKEIKPKVEAKPKKVAKKAAKKASKKSKK